MQWWSHKTVEVLMTLADEDCGEVNTDMVFSFSLYILPKPGYWESYYFKRIFIVFYTTLIAK
jgi:hypothetical protein